MPGFLPTPLAVKPGKEGREEGRANVFLSAYCAPGTALPQAGVTQAPLLAQSGPDVLGMVTQGWASVSGHLPFPWDLAFLTVCYSLLSGSPCAMKSVIPGAHTCSHERACNHMHKHRPERMQPCTHT